MEILLVEDNLTIVKRLEYSFQKEKYNLSVAINLKQAVTVIRNKKVDLIILDITLPDGNGLDFYENTIKKLNIPTIFLAAQDDEETVVIGISNKTPLYVIGFNKEKNELIVGEEKELYKKEFIVSDINWLLFDKLNKELIVDVKTRYSSKAYKAKIISEQTNNVKVIYDEPQKSITSGQSAVFYIGDIVVGGGKIK